MSPSNEYNQEEKNYRKYLMTSGLEKKENAKIKEIETTPLISLAAKHLRATAADLPTITNGAFVPQHGLLGHHIGEHPQIRLYEPILLNTNTPSSTFICGSQGSGKSHTLATMLENFLQNENDAVQMTNPMAGLAFHYDVCASNPVAEAATLAASGIKTRVLVSPSNFHKLKSLYESSEGHENIEVLPLRFQDHHLDIDAMHKLMAISESEGSVPLYMEVIQRILREMAIEGNAFSMNEFIARKNREKFSESQNNMMNMRLDLMQSFLNHTVPSSTGENVYSGQKCERKKKLRVCDYKSSYPDVFQIKPGTLTVVDLSDPFLDVATVCTLFNICLRLAISHQNRAKSGIVIALDEAHKYLTKSVAANNFAERLLGIVREQRHIAARIIVATQEPNISERLLDLCSMTIVHHFKSPNWFNAIKDHLGGASALVMSEKERAELFGDIVNLRVGESLVFAPSAFVCVDDDNQEMSKLGTRHMKMMTRSRKGVDFGETKLAVPI